MMNTPSKQQEQLSSLFDGELEHAELIALLASIKSEQGTELEQNWTEYAQISDALHSDELNLQLSDGFSARFSARLQQEPTIIAPAQLNVASEKSASFWLSNKFKVATGLAAVSVFAFVMSNQMGSHSMMPNLNSSQMAQQTTASDVQQVNANFDSVNPTLTANANDFAPKMETQVEMLRDPSLDNYLMAHQKASPSLDNAGRYIQKAKIDKSAHNEVQK
jgi:sigma-E factor negative regulatory protein RseA